MSAERPVWASTHVGRIRRVNEDRCLVGDWRSDGADANWQGNLSITHDWAVIADGMGGHEAGEVASRVVLDAISRQIGRVKTESDIERMIELANGSLFEAMHVRDGRPGMGTTIVGALLSGDEALIFNVGDSRAYRMGGDGLVQISLDDSAGDPIRPGHPRNHALTQCLGGARRRTALRPHIRHLRLAQDARLVLCSDGLTDMISDDEIAGILVRNAENPAEELVAAALEAGGIDNVTVVVVGPVTAQNIT